MGVTTSIVISPLYSVKQMDDSMYRDTVHHGHDRYFKTTVRDRLLYVVKTMVPGNLGE
jgi:hypothetical protein